MHFLNEKRERLKPRFEAERPCDARRHEAEDLFEFLIQQVFDATEQIKAFR